MDLNKPEGTQIGDGNTQSNTFNVVNNFHPPEGGLRTAGAVDCPPRTVRLGAYTAGRLFVGRDDELAELAEALSAGSGVITTGLGGVGKSTLAHRYAEVHRDGYNPIWWINAEDEVEIEAGLAGLARRLDPELAAMPDPDVAAWGRAWLSCHEGWLVILDNATDPAHVASLVGESGGGRFLLTSRLTTGWEELAASVPLDILTPQQALDLLTRATGRTDLLEGAGPLCEALGYLPLAVRLAAAYMKQNVVTAAEYLIRLTSTSRDVLGWTPTAGDPERTVARTWLVSLKKITDTHGVVPESLLRILAWLGPTDIPMQVLHAAETSSAGINEVDEALGRLAAYALITLDRDAVSVHRLVQAAARYTTGLKSNVSVDVKTGLKSDMAADVEASRKVAVSLLRLAAPRPHDPAGWPLWRRLVPHVDALATHAGPHNDGQAMLTLLHSEASYLHGQGQVGRSIALFERGVAGATDRLGPNQPLTLAFRNDLASAYRDAGDVERAIPLLERTLADSERALGPDHKDTLIFRNNLASTYRVAGDMGRAIPLFERAHADAERVLGPVHPITMAFRKNLVDTYTLAGDVGRAIPLAERTLADSERVLGPDHPNTLSARSGLADTYVSAGDLGRAIPLFERTLADAERVLGPDHLNTRSIREGLRRARSH